MSARRFFRQRQSHEFGNGAARAMATTMNCLPFIM
jgi:hypothetical protein